MKVGDIVQNERHIGVLVEITPDGICKVSSSKINSLASLKNLRLIRSAEEEYFLKEREKETERKEQERLRQESSRRKQERIHNESLRRGRERKRNELFKEIRHRLESNFLDVDLFYREFCSELITQEKFEQEKIAFVKSWIDDNTPSDKSGVKRLTDEEQAAAVAAVHGHIQVIARAGSGKTTTLVNRALFLMKHCGVDPSEMLLLAFNRKAASEIRRRLLAFLHAEAEPELAAEIKHRIHKNGSGKIDHSQIETNAVDAVAAKLNINLPHVMTFHALAYAIVHPDEDILYDGSEGEQKQSRAIQQVIDDHLQLPEFKEKIREMMLAHFKNDWERLTEGGYDLNKEEFLQFRRSLKQQSLNGDYIKSFGEKIIANFLFEHNIAYKYEQNHWWSDINYRPDFSLYLTEKTGVIIEYFGLQGDVDYDEMTLAKRDYWASKPNWTLIEIYPHDITSNGEEKFLSILKERLQPHGFSCERLSEEEIWQRIKDRAIDQFTEAMGGFIGKCRKFSYSVTDLQMLIGGYKPIFFSETMFHNLALTLYEAYLNRLIATGEEDFNGLMQRAADSIKTGKVSFERRAGKGDLASLRYIFIDEFQDFSDLFYRLLNAIRANNPTVELFCVGDDWQAINGFAGSDLRFFKEFTNHIGESKQLYISTNYRSSEAIVTVGNELMNGLGKPAIAHKNLFGLVIVADINKFTLSTIEKEQHPHNRCTPMILRLVNKALVDGLDVVILSHINPPPKYDDFIHSFFSQELKGRITFSTAHKYKGLEKKVVIIPDAFDKKYPLIHPNWIFSKIFGDCPEKIIEEERRLFYVAITRAINKLVIITETGRKSPFLDQLNLSEINWLEYPPVSSETTRLVVKVGNQERRGGSPTFLIKDLLKASRYQYQSTSKTWAKSFPSEGFSVDTIKAEVWCKSVDGIEVQIFNDTETLAARFLIDAGIWHCVVDKLGVLCAPTTKQVKYATYKLGDILPDGGIVFHVDASGKHGLEAKAADEPKDLTWSAAIAAASAYGSGWYLPTKGELNLLYQQKNVLGGFANGGYWSSTEDSVDVAWNQLFANGDQYIFNKTYILKVRAVRAF